MSAMIEAVDLTRVFGGGRGWFGAARPAVHAVRGISLTALQGETVGIVGESGCGKSTLARLLCGLLEPTEGSIRYEGRSLADIQGDRKAIGRFIQYVFQDPLSSLNPRKTIRQILETPLIHLHGLDADTRNDRLRELLASVNLREAFLSRYPHEFSGGQAQRIGIARALAAEPRVMLLDEPVSALDVSVQAQVLNLLQELRDRLDLTYLFVSHDLAVVEAISDWVLVLYFGQLVESGPARDVLGSPRHPYTHLLAGSAPAIGKPLAPLSAEPAELPDPLNPPPGCPFASRCPRAQDDCRAVRPSIDSSTREHHVACFHPLS